MSGLLLRQDDIVMDHGDQSFTLWSLWSLICKSIHHIHSLFWFFAVLKLKYPVLAHCNVYTPEFFPICLNVCHFSPQIRGTRTSTSFASGKQSQDAHTKNQHGQGAPPHGPHQPPRMDTWMMLKATIRLATSMALTKTKHPMVGPHPTFPGKDKTIPSDLSRPAKDKPADRQENGHRYSHALKLLSCEGQFCYCIDFGQEGDQEVSFWTKAENCGLRHLQEEADVFQVHDATPCFCKNSFWRKKKLTQDLEEVCFF